MAIPKRFTIDRPGISEPRLPTSPTRPIGLAQEALRLGQPFQYINVAFLGKTGSGRNSLAWRLDNLNDSELPVLPSLPHREITLETSTRPALRYKGVVNVQIRIVPPEDLGRQPPFFASDGEIHRCHIVVFVVDLGDEDSSNDFYTWRKKVKKCRRRRMPPFLIVGNKADLRLFRTAVSPRWGENTASLYSARAYLECSAKTNDRVGEVLDTILGTVL